MTTKVISDKAGTDANKPQTPFEMFGGEANLKVFTQRLYEVMDTAPEAESIRAMHAEDLSVVAGYLAGWMTAWMGGPRDYHDLGRPCMMTVHGKYQIGKGEAEAWLSCAKTALEDVDCPQLIKDKMMEGLSHYAHGMRNKD